jgi:hypothetical protein
MNSINAVIGPPGCGKTIYMTYWALFLHKLEFRIWSNYHFTRIPYTPIQDLTDFSDIDGDKVAVFLDEIHKSADSRDSFSPLNRFVTSDVMQYRKWGQDSHIFGSEQMAGLMDVRLRGVVTRVHLPKIILKIPDLRIGGKTIRGKPLLMRVESYLTGDPLKQMHKRRIPLLVGGRFLADEYDTNQRIEAVSMNHEDNLRRQLEDEYYTVGLKKVSSLATYIQDQEEAKGNRWPDKICSRVAKSIISKRELE